MKPYHGRGGEKEQKVIRMLFTTDAGVMTTQHLELYNSGSTAIFFYWRVNKIVTQVTDTSSSKHI